MEESDYINMALAQNLSLDEYMRRNAFRDQFSLIKQKKQDRNIDPVDLDMSLNEYIQSNPSFQQRREPMLQQGGSTGCGRFDRRSLRDGDTSDEEEGNNQISIDTDVDMKPMITIEEQGEDISDVCHFSTVESRNGIRIRSQQWRLLPENLLDRPEGVKRLAFLPYDEAERYKRVKNGRVKKRNRTSSLASSITSMGSNMTSGTFVEKKGFTYKFGNRNNGQDVGIIGIERAKRITPTAEAALSSSSSAPAININMNWAGFFDGFKQTVDTVREPNKVSVMPKATALPADDTVDDETNAVCDDLLSLIQARYRARRAVKENVQVQQNIAEVQGRNILFSDAGEDPNENNPIITDTFSTFKRIKLPYNVRLI